MKCKCGEYINQLEDVVNELDLSESVIEEHGPMGTAPADLVRLVLREKDIKIQALKARLVDLRDATEKQDEIIKGGI